MHFTTEQFQLQPENKCYVAEASELGFAPGSMAAHLYLNDNLFQCYGTDMDASGEDVMGWRFKPSMGTLKMSPAFNGWQVLIIND